MSNMLAVLPVGFGAPAPRLYGSGLREVAPVGQPGLRPLPGPVADCGYSLEPGRTVNVPMTQQLFDWTWAVQLDTFSAEERRGHSQGRRDTSVMMDIQPGLQSIQAPLTGAVDEKIEITMSDAGGTVCIVRVTIGNAVAGTP